MATSVRATYPKFKAAYATTNLPLSGGLLYTYTRGTTTAKTTYSDIGKTTANANPVVLDSAGEATIFLDGSYKFVLKDSALNILWTQDDVNVIESTTALASDYAFGLVTNGSFEDDTDGDGDPDGWTVTRTGTVALDATDANHGAQCLKFTSTGSGGGYITSSSFIEVSANNTYSIIFSVKSSVADIRNLVTVSWYDLDQVIIAGSPATVWDDSATNPTSWTEKRFSVTPAANSCFAKLTFHGCHSSDATSGNTKYDYIRMFDERVAALAVTSLAVTTITTSPVIESTDAGATVGPVLDLYRNSASPVNSDIIGGVQFSGKDAGAAKQLYGQIHAKITDTTAGNEDASIVIQPVVAGTATDVITVGPGVQIGAPTGTDKGAGTLNVASGIYSNGTRTQKIVLLDTPELLVNASGLTNGVTTTTHSSATLATAVATIAILQAGATVTLGTSTTVVAGVYVQKVGVAYVGGVIVGKGYVDNNAPNGDYHFRGMALVTLDASYDFDYTTSVAVSGGGSGTAAATIYLIGYMAPE